MPSTVDMIALLIQGMPPCLLYPTRRALSSLGPHHGACPLGCPEICNQQPEMCLSVCMMVASQKSVVVGGVPPGGLPLGLGRHLQARKTAVQPLLVTTKQLQKVVYADAPNYQCKAQPSNLICTLLGYLSAVSVRHAITNCTSVCLCFHHLLVGGSAHGHNLAMTRLIA